jgi:hypothetical protein
VISAPGPSAVRSLRLDTLRHVLILCLKGLAREPQSVTPLLVLTRITRCHAASAVGRQQIHLPADIRRFRWRARERERTVKRRARRLGVPT